MSRSKEHVVIVGGGVVGAMCAWYLHKAGHQVTILDKGKFGAACSHGNCGYVCPSHVLPLPQPGAIRSGMKDLLRPNSPFRIRMRWSPTLWHWFWRFAQRCNQSDMLEAAVGRSELLQSSQRLYKQLVAEEDVECEWREVGLLFVYQDEHHFEQFGETNELLSKRFGVEAESISGDELSKFEPALKSGLAGGWFYRDDCHLRPDLLMKTLRARLELAGVQIIENYEVAKFQRDRNACRSVSGGSQEISGDVFVVASGAWSPFLNRELGCKLPIQPGKGYSLTMPQPKIMPSRPIILEQHRVAITPLQHKYRIGSTMEFAGYDTSVDPKRLDLLKSSAELYLHEPHCSPIEEEWFGWRPMTWDGKPVIDRSPRMNNVWIAAGHNMLGLSMATGTGKLIAELIEGQQPHINCGHFSLARLKRG